MTGKSNLVASLKSRWAVLRHLIWWQVATWHRVHVSNDTTTSTRASSITNTIACSRNLLRWRWLIVIAADLDVLRLTLLPLDTLCGVRGQIFRNTWLHTSSLRNGVLAENAVCRCRGVTWEVQSWDHVAGSIGTVIVIEMSWCSGRSWATIWRDLDKIIVVVSGKAGTGSVGIGSVVVSRWSEGLLCLLCAPLAVWLNRDLLGIFRGVAENVLHVLVDYDVLLLRAAVAYWAGPGWCLLLQLEVGEAVEAGVVCTVLTADWDVEALGAQWALQRQDHGGGLDFVIVGLVDH